VRTIYFFHLAIAAVEETEFNLRVEENGQSTLTVIEGTVQFGTAFNTWAPRADTFSVAAPGKKCTKPAAADAKQARVWTEALGTSVAMVTSEHLPKKTGVLKHYI
jgi:hypothetical protein